MKGNIERFSLFANQGGASDNQFQTAEIAPYYVRPEAVKETIDKEFQKVASATEDFYWQTGARTYNFALGNIVTNTTDILKKKTQEAPQVKVLDVGAGDFKFESHNKELFGDKVVIYGLAANDIYREAPLRQTDEHHQFNNAEYLSTFYQEGQFDLIVSRQTYKHLVDPLGSIAEAYKTLAVNGTLCIDDFKVRGCEAYLESLIPFLQAHGYLVTGKKGNKEIESFIIQKTAEKPELKFPFEFLKITKDALHYQPTEQFLDYHKKDALLRQQLLFEQGKKLLLENNQGNVPYDWLCHCESLLELLSSSEYQTLSDNKLQYLYILVFVATHYDYSQYEAILSDCQIENARFKFDLLKHLYGSVIKGEFTGFMSLMSHSNFQRYQQAPYDEGENVDKGRKQQLRLIALTALEDILRLGRTEHNQELFTKMNLAFKARRDIDHIDGGISLHFNNIPSSPHPKIHS